MSKFAVTQTLLSIHEVEAKDAEEAKRTVWLKNCSSLLTETYYVKVEGPYEDEQNEHGQGD